MEGCELCVILENPAEEAVLWENKHLLAIVSRDQTLLGRTMVIFKRHVEQNKELLGNEVVERWRLLVRFERMVSKAFGAVLPVNDECLGNHAYRGVRHEEAHPHLHNHWVPRLPNRSSSPGTPSRTRISGIGSIGIGRAGSSRSRFAERSRPDCWRFDERVPGRL